MVNVEVVEGGERRARWAVVAEDTTAECGRGAVACNGCIC